MEISKKGSHGKESGSGNINEILENEKRAETKGKNIGNFGAHDNDDFIVQIKSSDAQTIRAREDRNWMGFQKEELTQQNNLEGKSEEDISGEQVIELNAENLTWAERVDMLNSLEPIQGEKSDPILNRASQSQPILSEKSYKRNKRFGSLRNIFAVAIVELQWEWVCFKILKQHLFAIEIEIEEPAFRGQERDLLYFLLLSLALIVLIEAKRVGKAALSVESHSQGVKSWLDSSSSNLCNGGRFSRT
ncbi:hypothetical protein V6N13_128292 [Hibiscus sabdariffa]